MKSLINEVKNEGVYSVLGLIALSAMVLSIVICLLCSTGDMFVHIVID